MRIPVPVLLFVFALGAQAQDPREGFIGSEVCARCHINITSSFFRNPHYRNVAAGKENPRIAGCESCHGPGQKHVAANGGKATIIAYSQLEPAEITNQCLRCHFADLAKSQIRRSAHTLADIACTSCHSIHVAPITRHLLAKDEREVCYDCHGNVRAQFSMPFKHRVNEGFMACSDCHNPHGTPAASWRMAVRPRMVEQAAGPEEACIRCHADKRGPFVFEHPAVRVDGCEVCHQPHGSPNARLLRRPVTFTLCLECHSGLGRFGRQADGIQRQSPTHNMADPRYQYCTACHVRIHGSNVDPRFLR